MLNKLLKFESYLLLAFTSFFVVSQVLIDNVHSINLFDILIKISLFVFMIFLSKYTNDLFLFCILKLYKLPIYMFYIFPFIKVNRQSKLFIDPMFLTRNYEYFTCNLSRKIVLSIKKCYLIFLQSLIIITVCLIYLFSWNIYLYLPIFIIYFGTNIYHPTEEEIVFFQSCNNNIEEIQNWDNKLISNLQFHFLALACIKNNSLIDSVLEFNFYNSVYKTRDLQFIFSWIKQNDRMQISQTFLSYTLGEKQYGKIVHEGIVPLHLKYYKIIIDNNLL